MGLDKIIEFLLGLISDLMPFYVVNVYEKTVVLRGGKIHRVKDQGFYWKIPFLDNPVSYMIATTTMETPVQSLITKDGRSVSIKTIIKYYLSDVELHTTAIYDATDAVSDLTQGHVMSETNSLNYEECRDTAALGNTITKKVRNEVKRYGIYIEQITLTNFIETRNYRLFNEN